MTMRFGDLVQDIFKVFIGYYEQEILDYDELKRCIELCEIIQRYLDANLNKEKANEC